MYVIGFESKTSLATSFLMGGWNAIWARSLWPGFINCIIIYHMRVSLQNEEFDYILLIISVMQYPDNTIGNDWKYTMLKVSIY